MLPRTLGRTGLQVSPIGFGGAPLGLTNYLSAYDPQSNTQRSAAIDAIVRALRPGRAAPPLRLSLAKHQSARIAPQEPDSIHRVTGVGLCL